MMRIISRLDIKSNNLIKGIRFEGLRKLGDPDSFAVRYYNAGIDEILLMDTVASLYGRNQLSSLIESVAKKIFVPLTIGGGIRTFEDAQHLFNLGADKVAINSASFSNLELIGKIASQYGSQAVVGSIETIWRGQDWECMYEQGRERSGVFLEKRINSLVDMGVGEILVTSVDLDGTQKGFDLKLAEVASSISPVPVVVGGGCGTLEDIIAISKIRELSAIAIGSAFHFDNISVRDAKNATLSTPVQEERRID